MTNCQLNRRISCISNYYADRRSSCVKTIPENRTEALYNRSCCTNSFIRYSRNGCR